MSYQKVFFLSNSDYRSNLLRKWILLCPGQRYIFGRTDLGKISGGAMVGSSLRTPLVRREESVEYEFPPMDQQKEAGKLCNTVSNE